MKQRVLMLALASTLAVGGISFAAPEAAPSPLDLYGRMHAALAADSAESVAAAAGELAARVRAEAARAPDAAPFEALAVAAEKMRGDDLAALREQFKEVSIAFAAYVDASGTDGAQLYHCPMVDAYWVQRSADAGAKNPYYGKSMLKCGQKVDKVGS